MEIKNSFINIDPITIESPKTSDTLFKWDTDFNRNACINWQDDSLSTYITGYKLAADMICTQILSDQGTIDTLVYPVCSLYRHYIELQLKEIIKDGNTIFQIERGIPQHHKIYELWKEARSIDQNFSHSVLVPRSKIE